MPTRPLDHVPRLRFRLTREDDLAECLALLPAWLDLGAGARAALPTLWRRLVREPAALHMVMEDLALPRGERIQAWGCSLLLAPADVQRLALEGDPAPGLAVCVYEALLDGSIVLHDDQALGRHNARGELGVLMLHFCARPLALDQAYAQAVIAVSNDSLRASLNGYHLDALYFETHADDAPFLAAAGFLRRPRPPAREASCLPWWKLWRGVYERFQDAVPDFFGDTGPADDEGKRGPEKRRQVLADVRQRPEELSPWAAASS